MKIGTSTVFKNGTGEAIILSKRLETEDFPNEVGAEIDVILVEDEHSGETFLRLEEA